jgi:uncharacterized protein (TIGR03663 family)
MKASSIAKQSKVVTPTAPPPVEITRAQVLRESVTVETLAYAGLVLFAAILRLVNLNAAPLTPSEAGQALAAFQGVPLPVGGSPLLYTINQLVFGLSGTSLGDAGARLGAALLGTLLVPLPWLYRKPLGRFGALAASLALAISPTGMFAARLLDGQLIATTFALAALGLGLRYGESRHARDLNWAAITIGLALTSGPGVMTLLIVIGLGSILAYRWIASDADRAQLTELLHDTAAWRQAALWGGATILLAASTMLFNLGGLRGVPEVLSAWLVAWHAPDAIGPLQLFQILLVYEPLIVWVGLAGLIAALRHIDAATTVLGAWSIGALLIALAQPGRQVTDLTLMLIPLALLAGLAIQRLCDALLARGAWGCEGAVWLAAVPLIGFLALTLGGYATGRNLIGNAQLLGQTMTPLASFAVLTGILALVVGGIFALALGSRAVLRAGAAALIGVLALIAIGNAWSVTQLRPGDPHELLWGPTATSLEVRPLIEAAQAASRRATGYAQQAAVSVALPQVDPVVAWYLRGFKNAQFTTTPRADAPIVITPLGIEPPSEPGAYLGAKFVTLTTWSPAALDDAALLRWWVYRQAGDPTPAQTLVVWVKAVQ